MQSDTLNRKMRNPHFSKIVVGHHNSKIESRKVFVFYSDPNTRQYKNFCLVSPECFEIVSRTIDNVYIMQ